MKENKIHQNNTTLIDSYGRIHNYVRISLTDKCNFNCIYCNPSISNSNTLHLSNKLILSYEELYRLVKIFVRDFGVHKIRFTGGEPLIRKDVLSFFKMMAALREQYDFEVGITTNGTSLLDKLNFLYEFGVDLLNISLDTLDRNKFIAITGKTCFDDVLKSIHRAVDIGFKSVKVNMVVIKGLNDDELIPFIEYFQFYPITVRFIEYMPFTGNQWDSTKFLSWYEMKSKVDSHYTLSEIESEGKVSKDYNVVNTNLRVGFISSISDHFCSSCNRLRVTASGHIKNCLFSNLSELNLKPLLSNRDVEDEVIATFIKDSLQTKWLKHPDIYELLKLRQNNMMTTGG
ncbi:MAG: GTP 3',8-cyclase MoaA [Ignavibacteria bacterium]